MAYTAWHDFVADDTLTAAQLDAIIENIKQLHPVGSYLMIAKAATTSETLVGGVWLECNAVSVLRATYPDLNTLLSGLSYPFGSADGTHFTLPDAQGRVAVSMASGGHADHNGLGDSDGIAKASRTARGAVAVTGTATGTVGGSTSSDGAHQHGAGTYSTTIANFAAYAGGGNNAAQGGSFALSGQSENLGAHTHTWSGSLASGAISGSGAVPGNYLVAGTLFIKAVA